MTDSSQYRDWTMRIITCYGCKNTYPETESVLLDEPACPRCGTRVSTSLDRGDGTGRAPMVHSLRSGTDYSGGGDS